MTATYTNDPGNRDIDTVRFEIDDRDTDNAQISDEEIQYLIDTHSHILLAASAAAGAIAATYASEAKQKTVGDLSINYGGEGRYATYKSLERSLRARVGRGAGAHLFAGGISKSDDKALTDNTDRVVPSFSIGKDDSDGYSESRGIVDY